MAEAKEKTYSEDEIAARLDEMQPLDDAGELIDWLARLQCALRWLHNLDPLGVGAADSDLVAANHDPRCRKRRLDRRHRGSARRMERRQRVQA